MSHAMFDYVERWMQKMQRTNHALYADVIADVYVLILNKTYGRGGNGIIDT